MPSGEPVFRPPVLDDLLAVRPQIESALVYCGGTHEFADVVGLVLTGRMQMWMKDASVILTEVVNYPRKRICAVFLAAGNQEDLKAMVPGIERWAVAQGCSEGAIFGRKGWLRSFLQADGWEVDPRVTLTRRLGMGSV